MDFITRIGTVSSVSYDKTNEQLLFSLKNSIGQTVLVKCSKNQLVNEVKNILKDGDEITVVGNSSEKQFFMEDNDIVIQAVVIIIDGLVYPSIFPNYVAFQYRDDELKRIELLKAELETYEPDEPF